jgi:PAS domain S-box-containing protein
MALQFPLYINNVKKTNRDNAYSGKPITDTIANGFFIVDHKWKVKYWNKEAERVLRIQAEDIIGKNLWEVFADVIPIEFYAVYHKAFLQDIPIHFEEYWGQMGAWFDVVTYYCDDALTVSFKSSNLRQSESQVQGLMEVNELYRFVSEITNDCLWEWDLQAKEIFWIDGGHKRIFGYPIENALIPQSFWESRLHPDDKAGVLKKLNKISRDGSVTVWEDDYRFEKANGDYAYVHDRGHIIYDANQKASRMVGVTRDITERVLLENKLSQERIARQKEVTDAVLTALEKEREDIGRELHDNLGQILVAAKLYIQMAKKNESERTTYLDESCKCIENVIREIRRISKALVIAETHIIGLVDNIQNLLNDLARIDPIKIEFYQDGVDERLLDEKLQMTIFRIVQEQLNNILKHAKATRATIHLSRHEDQVVLRISDNGVGCDIVKGKKGVGIINIRSRASLYDGRVTIVSKPGEGYELKVVLSLIAA